MGATTPGGSAVQLRDVTDADLPVFFEQQLDPDANQMAAFGAKDPADRTAFMAKWSKILRDESSIVMTILCDGTVAGHVLLWRDPALEGPEVSYWLGKRYWGRGMATAALSEFLRQIDRRPLFGRAAKDNIGSIRVLEKCGFVPVGRDSGFSDARGEDVEEVLYVLSAPA